MSGATPEPADGAGVNALRLDADRTRDELESTLQEIERRLTPMELKESLTRTYRAHPVASWIVGIGIAAAIASLVWRKVAKRYG